MLPVSADALEALDRLASGLHRHLAGKPAFAEGALFADLNLIRSGLGSAQRSKAGWLQAIGMQGFIQMPDEESPAAPRADQEPLPRFIVAVGRVGDYQVLERHRPNNSTVKDPRDGVYEPFAQADTLDGAKRLAAAMNGSTR